MSIISSEKNTEKKESVLDFTSFHFEKQQDRSPNFEQERSEDHDQGMITYDMQPVGTMYSKDRVDLNKLVVLDRDYSQYQMINGKLLKGMWGFIDPRNKGNVKLAVERQVSQV